MTVFFQTTKREKRYVVNREVFSVIQENGVVLQPSRAELILKV